MNKRSFVIQYYYRRLRPHSHSCVPHLSRVSRKAFCIPSVLKFPMSGLQGNSAPFMPGAFINRLPPALRISSPYDSHEGFDAPRNKFTNARRFTADALARTPSEVPQRGVPGPVTYQHAFGSPFVTGSQQIYINTNTSFVSTPGLLHPAPEPSPPSYFIDIPDPELRLLSLDSPHDGFEAPQHERTNAPLFTADVLDSMPTEFPQRAVLGSVISQHAPGFPLATEGPQIYINTNTPFSTVICGVQGSGKSHTASVLLEGCLISNQAIGTLPEPLAGLWYVLCTRKSSF